MGVGKQYSGDGRIPTENVLVHRFVPSSFLWNVAIRNTVKILKFGTPKTIAIIVLKIETFDVTLR